MTFINKLRERIVSIIGTDTFERHFNVPLKYKNDKPYYNERIVEWTFVIAQLGDLERTAKILDFGCTRSWLPLSLASMGHEVTGVDLRDFGFYHPQFTFKKGNIIDLQERDFDKIISLSTLEHVGLNAYGQEPDEILLLKVCEKIFQLLRKGGDFILTLPVGLPSIDDFERSFAPEEIKQIMERVGFHLKKEMYFKRNTENLWVKSDLQEISKVNNDKPSRVPVVSGVNGVGCLVFSK